MKCKICVCITNLWKGALMSICFWSEPVPNTFHQCGYLINPFTWCIEKSCLQVYNNSAKHTIHISSESLYCILKRMVYLFSTESPSRSMQSLGQVFGWCQCKIQHPFRDTKCAHHSPLHLHFHNGYVSNVLSALKKRWGGGGGH